VDLTLSKSEARLRELGPAVFDLDGLLAGFGELTDHRGKRGRRYALAPLLLIVVLAKLAGEDALTGIADWAAERLSVLATALGLAWPRMPHQNTFRRVLAFVLEPDELDQLVSLHLIGLAELPKRADRRRLLAFDGKTHRGTICEENPRGTHLLCAYLTEEGLTLGQVEVEGKENEIVAAPELLAQIDLSDKIAIADAMHSQRELSKRITERGGDFIWLIKENQPSVREEIEALFAPSTPTVLGNHLSNDFTAYQERGKEHGRREWRRIVVSSELTGYTRWPALEQVFRLERERKFRSGEVEREVVYGLTSLTREEASAKQLFDYVRAYWRIENGLFYRRDVTFREDRLRQTVGNQGRVMASLSNLTIGLLRTAGFTNLARARRICNALFNHPNYLALGPTLT
jgi:predicted transposase YbfD/YdcC